MKGYINTSNYYLSTTTTDVASAGTSGSFDVAEITVDGVTLPEKGYYWLDIDFGDVSKREIFRIKYRVGYTLYYDNRISPYGMHSHTAGASVGLRDFSELLNSLSANTDNFGQVEIKNGLTIGVFGGNITISGKETRTVEDAEFTLTPNHTSYIEYDVLANTFDEVEILTDGNYPVAKITTADAALASFEDMRYQLILAKSGDMEKSVYDPDNINGDVFAMENMKQGNTKLYITPSDKNTWNGKQDALASGTNIKTINGESIVGGGNLNIPTVASFAFETTNNGVASYTLTNDPITDTAFIVFTNSGTMLIKGVDYTYNSTTNTITFTPQLASNEHAVIWLSKSAIDPTTIGNGKISIELNGEVIDNFYVNQTADKTIDIGTVGEGAFKVTHNSAQIAEFSANATTDTTLDLDNEIGNGTLTVKYGGVQLVQFSANTPNNATFNIEKSILVTAEEYGNLPETKETDGNFYYIYS